MIIEKRRKWCDNSQTSVDENSDDNITPRISGGRVMIKVTIMVKIVTMARMLPQLMLTTMKKTMVEMETGGA